MQKIELFNKFYAQYDNWFKKNKYAYKSEFLAIKKLLPNNKKTIEIGVGSARFTFPLSIKIGIDPFQKKCKKLLKKEGF